MKADPASWQQQAQLLLRLHRPADAARLAAEQVGTAPHDERAHLLLGYALLEQQQLTAAEQAARQAVALNPEQPGAYYLLGLALQYQGRYWNAEEALARALHLDPGDPNIHGRRSANLYLQRRPHEALDAAAEGLALDPQHPECLMWRALAAEASLRPDLTDRTFATLLQLAPDNASVHANLGAVLWHRREVKSATRHLREALRLDPTIPEPRRLLRTIEQAFPPKPEPAPITGPNPLPWWGWLAWLMSLVLAGEPLLQLATSSTLCLGLYGLALLVASALVVYGSGKRRRERWLPGMAWLLAVGGFVGLAGHQYQWAQAPTTAALLLRLGALLPLARLAYAYQVLHRRHAAIS
jgi:Tfp pilus assembly protein PilF